MFTLKPALRLAISVGLLASSLIWVALGVGVLPDPQTERYQHRFELARCVSVAAASIADSKRYDQMQAVMRSQVAVEDDLLSLGVRRTSGDLIAEAGPHEALWQGAAGSAQDDNQVTAEILANGRTWGTLEMVFRPNAAIGWDAWIAYPFSLALFVGCSVTLLAWFVFSKTFQYLNPSKVVPDRVRSALDTLAEGLILLNSDGEIAHVNRAFEQIANVQQDAILGKNIDSLDWTQSEDFRSGKLPWSQCLLERKAVCGEILELSVVNRPRRKFMVNATPVMSDAGECRGVLVSFDDVTAMESKKQELSQMIKTLRQSRDEVERKNEQLNFLVSYDSLTGCLNRREFFSQYDLKWNSDDVDDLTLLMMDIDHFKQVNDNHGHSSGDEVLRSVGKILQTLVKESGRGIVGRFGGEEFIVLLTNYTIDEGMKVGEEIRKTIEDANILSLEVTISVGVSCRDFQAMDAQHLLDQADGALYAGKKGGRNRVVRFDQIEVTEEMKDPAGKTERGMRTESRETIPYAAVNGLLSALSLRCEYTTRHCLRVAHLCVSVGKSVLNQRELYTLEIAALMHDIGKIGVPDSVLKNTERLTDEERKLMRQHDEVGVEIVRSAFTDEVADIIKLHNRSLKMRRESASQSGDGDGTDIPISSKIISVCDAFDAMTCDSNYRKGCSIEEAIAELERCSPDQFDPDAVEMLTQYVTSDAYRSAQQDPMHVWSGQTQALAVIEEKEFARAMTTAIEDRDPDNLAKLVTMILEDTQATSEVSEISAQLDVALSSSDVDFEAVLGIANDLLAIVSGNQAQTSDLSAEAVT